MGVSFQKIVVTLFGSIRWFPPLWFQTLITKIVVLAKALFARWKQFRFQRPRWFWATHGGLLLLLIGGIAGYFWYQSLPKPTLHSFSVTKPSPTPLSDEPTPPDPVRFLFDTSVAPLEQVGKEVTAGVQIHPALEGTWTWLTDTFLLFTPKFDWPVGEEYHVRFAKEFFPKHIRLDRYEATFSSPRFVAKIQKMEFYQDPVDPKIKKVVATLHFSHSVDPNSLERAVKLNMKGKGKKKVNLKITYNKFQNEAYLHSETISIPPKDVEMVLTMAEGVVSNRGGPPTKERLTQRITIPGIYNFFKIGTASIDYVRNPQYEMEQVLVVETTDGVRSEQIQKKFDVYLLPVDKPALQGQEKVEKYEWSDPEEIVPEILKAAERVKLENLPTERDFSSLHSFRLDVPPNRYLYARIKKGLVSYGGYVLPEEWDQVIPTKRFPKQINVLPEGAILSLSGRQTLTVLSQGVKALHFEVGRVLPDEINHLVSQSGGRFDSPDFTYDWQFNQDNITERKTEIRELLEGDPKQVQYTSFDLGSYLKEEGERRQGLFFLKVSGYNSEYKEITEPHDRRFLLITDLGLLVKDTIEGGHEVFVVSIRDGTPVGDATVEIIGKNGLPIFSRKTDASGHAAFPSFEGLGREKTPTVYLVRNGHDLSFLPFGREDRRLNLSRFETGGIYTQTETDGATLDAYLFSDRGIYRPGEAIHVGFIVREADWARTIASLPLEAAVIDPRGLEVEKYKVELAADGFGELSFKTEENAPTGEYHFEIYIVKDGWREGLLGSTAVRVAEFQPDRMRISTQFSEERDRGWVHPHELKGLVSLSNLFGTVAENRSVSAYITLNPYPAISSFKEHEGFFFFDPNRAEKSYHERFNDQTTDEQGETVFDLDLKRFGAGTYRLIFTAEGYEAKGGRAVTSQRSLLVSPLAYLIGYKPDGDLSFITKEASRQLTFLAVDPSLKKVKVSKLSAEIVELRYVSVLTKQPNETYKYESVQKEIPVSKKDLTIAAEGTLFSLPTEAPGTFALILRSTGEKELQRVVFNVAGEANLTRSLEKNAELQIHLNKEDYQPGEGIEMEIIAPYTGAGLITIERDRIYAHKWFRTTTTSSVQTLILPESVEGNAYLNVSFVRDLHSPEVFMSPLSYGVVPFTVSREKRVNPITLHVPEVAKPGKPFPIQYQSKYPGRMVLFAIDEGILQVARYKTPDPLAHFFRKRALEVATHQILDLILPEFQSKQLLSATGGDEEADALGRNINPFKRKGLPPVVFWSGILEATPAPKTLYYDVPEHFNGTLRVMAVVVNPQTIGVTEQKSLVQADLILSPNVPLFVAPGDTFQVSCAVTNNVAGPQEESEVKLELATSTHLEIVGDASQKQSILPGKEGPFVFSLKAGGVLGAATLTFQAALAAKKNQQTVELSLRPPNPYVTQINGGLLKKGAKEIPTPRQMYPDHRKLELAAAASPIGILPGLANYLDGYPHLCTEQLVSKVMPYLLLKEKPHFSIDGEKAQKQLEHVLKVLRARQNSEGAFGFWAANSHVSPWQTIYTLHFLSEAKERGVPGAEALLKRGLDYLLDFLGAEPEDDSLLRARTKAYALYILTRNGILFTNGLVQLVEDLEKLYPKEWKKDLTGLYVAATYQLLQKSVEADAILDQVAKRGEVAPDLNYFYDGQLHEAQYLYILAKHFPEKLKNLSGETLATFFEPWTYYDNYSTIHAGYTVMGLNAYLEVAGELQQGVFAAQEIFADGQKLALTLPEALLVTTFFSEQAQKIRLENKGELPLFYQVIQAGFDVDLPTAEIKQNLEVFREYLDEKGNVITEAPLGSTVEVRLRIRSLETAPYPMVENVAVVDLLPGGFEVDLASVRSSDRPWKPQYVDAREDRVVLYGMVNNSLSEYKYKIRATNVGTYSVPPIFAQAMYDRSMQALSKGGKIVVQER